MVHTAPQVPEELQCKAPNCKDKRYPRPEEKGGGFYDYCSLSCRDAVSGM